MTEKTPEPTVPDSKRLKSGSPKPAEQTEAAMEEIARNITPEVHTLNQCARAASAPPGSARPIAVAKRRRSTSVKPSVDLRRRSSGESERMPSIEGSPAPNEGGKKGRTRRRNRHRRTRKH